MLKHKFRCRKAHQTLFFSTYRFFRVSIQVVGARFHLHKQNMLAVGGYYIHLSPAKSVVFGQNCIPFVFEKFGSFLLSKPPQFVMPAHNNVFLCFRTWTNISIDFLNNYWKPWKSGSLHRILSSKTLYIIL